MAGWGEAFGAVFGHFSPDRIDKRKRIELDKLYDQKNQILNDKYDSKKAKKLENILAKIKKLERKLTN